MKKVLVFIIISAGIVLAAVPSIVWNKTANTDQFDLGYALFVDNSNVYVAAGSGFNIIKYDTDGNEMWKRIDTNGTVLDMTADNDYLYLTGYLTHPEYNLRVAKFNKDSTLIWTKEIELGYDSPEIGYGICEKGNYVYITGDLLFNLDYDHALIVLKCNKSDGDTVWSTMLRPAPGDPSASGAHGYAISVDDNYLYVVGYIEDTTGYKDIYLVKYDFDGNREWLKRYDYTDVDRGRDITVDNNYIYITGLVSNSDSTYDILTAKFDKDGNEIWEKTYSSGTNKEEAGLGIDQNDDYIYVTGYVEDSIITLKYAKDDGSEVWQTLYNSGSGNTDIGHDIFVKGDYFYITGKTGNTAHTYADIRTMKYQEQENKLITVLAPNGGEDLKVGDVYTINWSYTGPIDSVIIEYRNESTNSRDTIAVVENTGSYDWMIPDTPGDSTIIFVSDKADYNNVSDSSNNYFKISKGGSVQEEPMELKIEFSVNGIVHHSLNNEDVTLIIYRVDGSVVDEMTIRGEGSLKFDMPSGVYFIAARRGEEILYKKITLINQE